MTDSVWAQAVSQCKNYELAKEHLFISAESIHNEKALTQCIYQTVGDIAICPNLKLLDRNGKMIGLKVAPEFLKLWKTDENEVIKAAVRNSSKLYPARYYNFLKALFMQEYKGEDFMEEDSSSVLLEGNEDKWFQHHHTTAWCSCNFLSGSMQKNLRSIRCRKFVSGVHICP